MEILFVVLGLPEGIGKGRAQNGKSFVCATDFVNAAAHPDSKAIVEQLIGVITQNLLPGIDGSLKLVSEYLQNEDRSSTSYPLTFVLATWNKQLLPPLMPADLLAGSGLVKPAYRRKKWNY